MDEQMSRQLSDTKATTQFLSSSVAGATGSDMAGMARIKQCLIECGVLEDLAGMRDDILDADAADVSADAARRLGDIEHVIAWLGGSGGTGRAAGP